MYSGIRRQVHESWAEDLKGQVLETITLLQRCLADVLEKTPGTAERFFRHSRMPGEARRISGSRNRTEPWGAEVKTSSLSPWLWREFTDTGEHFHAPLSAIRQAGDLFSIVSHKVNPLKTGSGAFNHQRCSPQHRTSSPLFNLHASTLRYQAGTTQQSQAVSSSSS